MLDRRRNHNIDVVVDRVIVRGGVERRLAESVEVALGLADDIVVINSYDEGDRLFSRRLACVDCGLSMPEMTPRAFSFNSPHGACTGCQGLGATIDFDPRLVVPDESKSLADGAIAPWARGDRKLVREALQSLSRDFGDRPVGAVRQAAAQAARDVSAVGREGRMRADASKASCRTCGGATKTAPGPSRPSSRPSDRCVRARSATGNRLEAAEPGGPRQETDAGRLRRPADLGSGEGVRRARADRSRGDHRRAHSARDSGAPAVPATTSASAT